jgi:hypothetical protein
LRETDSLRDALQKLSGNHIISAPVESVTGFRMVDFLDIALVFVKMHGDPTSFDLPLSTICNESGQNPYVEMSELASLREAARELGGQGRPRIVIRLERYGANPSSRMLSQFDVVRWLYSNPSLFPSSFWETPLSSLIPQGEILFTIKEDEKMIDALQKIAQRRYSGAAVISSRGMALCNFSISDLGSLSIEKTTELLDLTVYDYMIQTKKVPKQLIHCPKDAKLWDAVSLLMKEHIHHIFITEPLSPYSDSFSTAPLPIGIFSVNNIVMFLHRYLQE